VEYGKFGKTIEDLGIAEMRKHLLDKALIENCAEELREGILYFDKHLKKEVKKMEKLCKETWYNVVGDEEFLGEENLDVRGLISIGRDYPTLHPLQSDDRQTLWDLLVDESCRSNKAHVRTDKMKWNHEYLKWHNNEKRKRAKSDRWMMVQDLEKSNEEKFIDSLNVSSDFYHLYRHSFLALTDLIYVRTFETEIKIIEEPDLNLSHRIII